MSDNEPSDPRDRPQRAPDEGSHTLTGVLSLIQRGERGAPDLEQRLNAAFNKHVEKLRSYCGKELRGFPPEVVEEVTQEVLLEAWKKLPTYRAESRFRAFLWSIAAHKCANTRRKRTDVLSEDGLLEIESTERSALEKLSDEERNQIIETAAHNVLDASEQEIIHLRWVLDYPHEDIAILLELQDREQVRSTLARCKRRMETEILRLLANRGHGHSFL